MRNEIEKILEETILIFLKRNPQFLQHKYASKIYLLEDYFRIKKASDDKSKSKKAEEEAIVDCKLTENSLLLFSLPFKVNKLEEIESLNKKNSRNLLSKANESKLLKKIGLYRMRDLSYDNKKSLSFLLIPLEASNTEMFTYYLVSSSSAISEKWFQVLSNIQERMVPLSFLLQSLSISFSKPLQKLTWNFVRNKSLLWEQFKE